MKEILRKESYTFKYTSRLGYRVFCAEAWYLYYVLTQTTVCTCKGKQVFLCWYDCCLSKKGLIRSKTDFTQHVRIYFCVTMMKAIFVINDVDSCLKEIKSNFFYRFALLGASNGNFSFSYFTLYCITLLQTMRWRVKLKPIYYIYFAPLCSIISINNVYNDVLKHSFCNNQGLIDTSYRTVYCTLYWDGSLLPKDTIFEVIYISTMTGIRKNKNLLLT